MRKRILSSFCALALCLTMLPATALAADAPVLYLGWDAETNSHEMASCDNYTVVTAETAKWNTGWYVVNDTDLWINGRIEVEGDVSLILTDGASLNVQGIHVGSTDSLTIYGQSAGTGRLTARPEPNSTKQAVIGGNSGESGGTIAIHGGNIVTQSDMPGMGASGAGAGIGGGANGDGGTIIITGGMIQATGGWADSMEGLVAGAAIGGGSGGDSGTISISGGKITASSSGMGVAGIGGGSGGTNDVISITGGYFYEGDLMQNKVSGVQVAEGLSVILQYIDNQVWYMVTDQVGELTISGGTAGTDYTWENGVITILTSTPLTISGNGMVCKERIMIDSNVSAELTVRDVKTFTVSTPLEIPTNSTLYLTLEGENTMDAADGSGIRNAGSLTIQGDGSVTVHGAYGKAGIDTSDGLLTIAGGTITAFGGMDSAGIGGNNWAGGGEITITGGTVNAYGKERGAGIGGGQGAGGGTITITGGVVNAEGGYWGAGIGGGGGDIGGGSGDSGSIKISGGEVSATGGSNGGAGIGGGGGSGSNGSGGDGETIEITGGTITATASSGAGIGSGGGTSSVTNCGTGGEITITGGTVTASSNYGAGIGGGSTDNTSGQVGGEAGTITVSGGTVTATGGSNGVGIGGSGPNQESGSFSTGTNGNAVIFTNSIGNQGSKDNWNGIFFEGDDDGKIYGSQVSPQEDFTIPLDKKLAIGSDQTLTIPGGVLVTNSGTITAEESSSLINNGVLVNNGTTPDSITGTGTTIKQDGTTVDIQQGGDTVTVTLPESGGTITPNRDGSVTLPGGSAVQTDESTKITVSGDGATVTPAGEVVLPGGGCATVTDSNSNTTTVTVSESGGSLTFNEDGKVGVPDGSTVQTGNGPEITVEGNGVTVMPDGEVTLPGSGSAVVSDSAGNTTTITVVENGGTIVPNEDGSVTLPAGSTVQTGNGPEITVNGENTTVTPAGEVNLPGGGSVTIDDGNGNITVVTVPEAGGTITPDENGSVVLPGGSSVTVADGAGGSTTVTVPNGGGTLDPSTGAVVRHYTVTFDSNGGSAIDSIVVAENSPVIKPADPTREGYTFNGWYQDEACTIAWDFANMTVTADITLYAAWRQIGSSSAGGSSSGSSSSVTGSGSNVSVSASSGSVTSYQMESAVNKADEGSAITIKSNSSTTISLPVDGMAAAADNSNDIVVDLRYGEVTLSAQAIAALTDGVSSTGKIKVSITSQTSSKDETISDLLDKNATVFDVSVVVNDVEVHSFGGTLSIGFTVPNLSQITDPHILHILSDGTKEYYAPDSISGSTITVNGVRNLSVFAVIPGSEVPQEQTNPFTDVYESDYYYDAVLWAVANGVTAGTSATVFSPDMAVSRAQMVTFLWRAYGSPEATGTNPFMDISASDYYYDAVLWAVANGVTVGTGANTFSPDAPVTRAQAVTFQWRAAGSPVVSGSSFDDVAADTYYVNAVTWAVANGITAGTSTTTFSPDVVVSRAQAMTFLWREQA